MLHLLISLLVPETAVWSSIFLPRRKAVEIANAPVLKCVHIDFYGIQCGIEIFGLLITSNTLNAHAAR